MFRKGNGYIKRIVFFALLASIITASVTGWVKTAAASKVSVQAGKIVKEQVSPSDSKKKKLQKLFRYAEKTYGYGRSVGFEAYDGWEEDFALQMYSDKKGSCYHFAAAYAFLAKKAAGYPTRIGIGKTTGFGNGAQAHAWVEVKIKSTWYICDPNMDRFAEDSSGRYFLKKRNSLKKVYGGFKGTKYHTVSL